MCGIAGIAKCNGRAADAAAVGAMVALLRHRGPDEQKVWSEGSVALGHARLSILDLAGGSQPMESANGSLRITFNGEIFNYVELREELGKKGHRFRTRSDTEVILAAYREYGEDCVQHFNGQWAFAIWNSSARTLFLSRDRLGVRPLFYTFTGDSFAFASEIKAFLACPEIRFELDVHALHQILTFWVILPPRTAFKNIAQLPPGCSLTVHEGEARIRRYWKLDYAPAEQDAAHEKRLAEELLALLTDATAIRLRSDVPVGAYLSGGIDSTVTTALMSRLAGQRLRSFSVSFDDAEFDESTYQREASAFLQTQHTDVRCSTADIARVFSEVVWHAEQPILRTAPAPLYLLSRQVREAGFKVVLTGEGADEMLGGYDIFKEAKIRRFWGRRLDSQWRPLLLKRLYPYMDNLQRQSPAYWKSFFRVDEADLANPFFSHLPRWGLTAKLKTLLSERWQSAEYDAMADLACELPQGFESWDKFNQGEYLEAMYLLPGYLLAAQGDRMAMANAVEGRYPFLDHRVVEFAAKLPPKVKMKVLKEKHLLKLAAAGLIPESIRQRAKQPYRAPDGKSFFGTTIPDYAQELLSPERIEQDGVFSSERVTALVEKFRRGRAIGAKDNMAAVAILSTQLLLNTFVHQHDRRSLHALTIS